MNLNADVDENIQGERILEFLLHVLENEESEEAQAAVCAGISSSYSASW
jgi:hypothetical protein